MPKNSGGTMRPVIVVVVGSVVPVVGVVPEIGLLTVLIFFANTSALAWSANAASVPSALPPPPPPPHAASMTIALAANATRRLRHPSLFTALIDKLPLYDAVMPNGHDIAQ
ncbi:hypothetical protein [Lacisediminimonas sp.]|uniref:hypothetical protein n=1 Tax=Lacisediminimonas sp. TaxID=3060582 RepID=UPI00271DDD94|nr:hypothetical protein [Lacisediminimonas sp.]MDO8300776.1 hypothetical protein [Lacisediminimonas sp.]